MGCAAYAADEVIVDNQILHMSGNFVNFPESAGAFQSIGSIVP